MWILAILMAVLAYIAASRLKKPTTNSALLAFGVLLFSPVVFGYAVLRFFEVKKSQPSEATPFVGLLLIAYMACALALFGIVSHFDQVAAVKLTLNSILESEAGTKGVSVKYVNIPQHAGIPFIGPNDYSGYFSANGLNGSQCQLSTFGFTVQTVANDGSWVVNIPGNALAQIQACTN